MIPAIKLIETVSIAFIAALPWLCAALAYFAWVGV